MTEDEGRMHPSFVLKKMTRRKIILGVGNLLNRDEGVGIHAVRALQTQNTLGAEWEVVDGGTLGLNLLPLVEEASHLIVLDAMDARRAPGTLIELPRAEVPLFSTLKMSQHQLLFQEVLALAHVRGRLPEHLVVLGIQPADLEIGVELSAAIALTMPKLLARVEQITGEWNQQ
jgi:hydrogenase maturation protease